MAVGIRKTPRVFSCRTCASVQTTYQKTKKDYCSSECWYKRNSLPNGHRKCSLCGSVKKDSNFTKGVARCKPCRTDSTKAYVERLKAESFVKWVSYRTLESLHSRGIPFDRVSLKPILHVMFEIALESGECVYCNNRITSANCSLDHKTPLSRGGTHAPENLHIICLRCNLMKGNINHESFLEIRALLHRMSDEDRFITEARLLSGNSRFTRKGVS